MVRYWLMVALIVGVLQVCTADEDYPVDVSKLCSVYELQRAKNAGVSHDQLREANAIGLTCDEMIRVMPEHAVANNKELDYNLTELLCNIVAPERTLLTNLSTAQDANLKELFEYWKILRPVHSVLFVRGLCGYASNAWWYERNAKGSDSEVVPFTKTIFWSGMLRQSRNASNEMRVQIAIQMCYVLENRQPSFDYMNPSTPSTISDEEMKGFLEHWSYFFDEAGTFYALRDVCDFLISKNILNFNAKNATIDAPITFDQQEIG